MKPDSPLVANAKRRAGIEPTLSLANDDGQDDLLDEAISDLDIEMSELTSAWGYLQSKADSIKDRAGAKAFLAPLLSYQKNLSTMVKAYSAAVSKLK